MIGTVTATRLNVRARPNLKSRKLGELAKGTVVDVLGQKNGWVEIQFQNIPAFVSEDYVSLQERPPRRSGVVTASMLNVRDRPDGNGIILGTLVAGSVVEVLSTNGSWVEIPFHQGTAFISLAHVSLHERSGVQRGVVTASLLNVRANPQPSARIIGQLQGATELMIESTVGDWHEIPFNNSLGYVSGRHVRLIEDIEVFPDVPIDLNETEVEEEIPPQPVVPESAEEGAELVPARQFRVVGTGEERKVAAAWNRFGGLLEKLSDQKHIDVACAVAVLCVESSGKGFEPSNQGRVIIRFENHKFWKYWGSTNPDRFRQHFTYKKGEVWKGHKWRKLPDEEWQTFHGSQRAEWKVLGFARSLDDAAALMSISMGAPQIMGFHFQALGYRSPQEMFDAFTGGVSAQISGLFNFMSPAMVQRLQQRDFIGFARLYNGNGQKEKYGRWIKNHYNAFKRLA